MANATAMPAEIRNRWGHWHPEERAWLNELRNRLRNEYNHAVQQVVLFGSKARDDWHDESDIDVLVIVHDKAAESQREIVDLSSRLSAGKMVLPGIITQTETEWARLRTAQLNFYTEVEKEGLSVL